MPISAPTQSTPQPRHWGTVAQAAESQHVSTKTIRRWIADGIIYAERIGPRRIRVDLDSLETAGTPLQYVGGGSA